MVTKNSKGLACLLMFICIVALPGGAHGETITIDNKAILTDQIENFSDDFNLVLEPESRLAVSDQKSSVTCTGRKADILLKQNASITNLGDETGNHGIVFAAAPDAEGLALYSLTLEDRGSVSTIFEGPDAAPRNWITGVLFADAALGNLVLDNGSSVTAHGMETGSIYSHGVKLEQVTSSDLILNHGSSITGTAVTTGERRTAMAVGIEATIADDSHVKMDNSSSITATALAETGKAQAYGVSLGQIHLYTTAELTLDNASGVKALAKGQRAEAHGLLVNDSEHGIVGLDNGSYLKAEAVSTLDSAIAKGLGFHGRGGVLDVLLDNGSAITASAQISKDGISEAKTISAVGAWADNARESHIRLDNGSYIQATAGIDTPGAAPAEGAGMRGTRLEIMACGVAMNSIGGYDTAQLDMDNDSLVLARASGRDSNAAGVMISDSPHGVISLDHGSVIRSEASGLNSTSTGVLLRNVQAAEITLKNNSSITASGNKESIGVNVSQGTSCVIDLDTTSSITGKWAVRNEKIFTLLRRRLPDSTVVNNSGQLNGRLEVATLNNSSSGRLGALLDSDSPFRVTTGNLWETESYFHVTGTATLEKGSTVILGSRDNFGLKKFGDSNQYYVMKAGDGDWTKDDINLLTKSPLLGLSWSEKSDDNNLVITTIMKKPSEAGISPNAGQAAQAAIDAGIFDFDSDPEEWTPNSNGAFLMGIINSVKSMQTGVGNRLGGLRGVNSGDDLVFDQGLWFETIYTSAAQDDRDGVGGFDADTTNLIFGYDCQSGPGVMGFALTLGNTDAQANARTENHDVKDNLLTIYGSYDFGAWFSEASFSLGQGKVDGFRLAGDQALTASYDSKVYSAMVSGGINFSFGNFKITPMVCADFSHKVYDDYREQGGDKALMVNEQEYDMINIGAGVKAQRSWKQSWGLLTSEVSSMLYYDIVGDRFASSARFAGNPSSTPFVTMGPEPLQTSWQGSAGLTIACLENNISLKISCDYLGREDFNATSISSRLRFEF